MNQSVGLANLGLTSGILAVGLLVGNLVGAVGANQTWMSPQVMRIAYGALLVGIGIRYMIGLR